MSPSSSSNRPGADPLVASTQSCAPSSSLPVDRREHSPAASAHDLRHAANSTGNGDSEEDEDDYTSSSGSSDSDSDDEDEETIAHEKPETKPPTDDMPRIPSIPKPRIHRIEKNPDLLSRLSAFLPQMKTANEHLEQEIAAGRAKDVRLDDMDDDEEGHYIEMNLGLGVLEEKQPDEESNNAAEDESEGKRNEHVLPERPKAAKDSNVLDTLMGNAESSSEKPTIEEI
ncbi:hypothetical protein BO94DRAFT_475428 [Aspergillus sclerotioniger CBS 115572]|uniref:Uncharacterized protein n=1 Tax=Aspergillus sclerotioniger CBS 115572 TaxID=1450535 RepID=A0A317VJV9_9EURO|nr:hypothetical protein BO94DRAFT_475428 [Aspergillus sclerotioniger CBS 115572]PWY73142.1 hypothetical protein BO94DRAFT_475428 [Aspergillus sclerotioniger CBS 115572]